MSAKPITQIILFRASRFFVLIFISLAAIVLLIDPPVTDSRNLTGDLLQISADIEDEIQPDVAFNPLRQEYLVVWKKNLSDCGNINARRIAGDGTFLGDPFVISTGCPDNRDYPHIAYNSVQDQYLIVWGARDTPDGWAIRARRLSGTGQLLDDTDIEIYNPPSSISSGSAVVAYASVSDRYLVAWRNIQDPSLDTTILGQVVTGEGTLEGNDFTITDGSSSSLPDLAYNEQTDRYLVVWQMTPLAPFHGLHWGIFGQQVLGSGGLYEDEIEIAFNSVDSTNPSVAALPASPGDEKFMVVWRLHEPFYQDLYGVLLDDDGTLGSDFQITATEYVAEANPDIIALEDTLQYFAIWSDPTDPNNIRITGQALSYLGELEGQKVEFSPGTEANFPAGATGGSGNEVNILAVWRDQSQDGTNTDIYGQMWTHTNLVQIPILLKN